MSLIDKINKFLEDDDLKFVNLWKNEAEEIKDLYDSLTCYLYFKDYSGAMLTEQGKRRLSEGRIFLSSEEIMKENINLKKQVENLEKLAYKELPSEKWNNWNPEGYSWQKAYEDLKTEHEQNGCI